MDKINNPAIDRIDYVLVVNRDFTIVYNSRFDGKIEKTKTGETSSQYINRNFFESFPTIRKEDSSIMKTMTTGEVVTKRQQQFLDFNGNIFCTDNITYPIIKHGEIIGAVELTKDYTNIANLYIKNFSSVSNSSQERNLPENQELPENPSSIKFHHILTVNESMKNCIEHAKVLAKIQHPTLIYGETGTGKELLAQAMMNEYGLPKNKIIIQNCAAVPENLVESILFGTQKGAYTGAETRKGLFEEADNGVFFLDELNSLPIQVQGKLLRVLQDGTFRPVGSNQEKKVNVKIIAAMNVEPLNAIEKGQLRRDLFYRLSGGMIYLPPLRDRKDDILFFTQYYLDFYNNLYKKNITSVSSKLQEVFLNYHWHGNVRELKNIMDSMISIFEGEILDVMQLPAYMYGKIENKNTFIESIDEIALRNEKIEFCKNNDTLDLKQNIKRMEEELINKALKLTDGNKTKAGELLGIPRQTLKYKLDRL